MLPPRTSISISRLALSLVLMLCVAAGARAQGRLFSIQKDTVPLFRGFALSFDVAGAAQKAMSDYGQYEAALRVNLHDQYFPIFELGYGMSEHDDLVTGIYYKANAPYFRLGCDLNLLKNKHQANRLYGGFRYAFTAYKVDVSRPGLEDPVWGWSAPVNIEGASCYQHWFEIVFGVDAKIWGPLHLGWSARYKRRIAHGEGEAGNAWYVPGYGKAGDTRLGATFNVIIDI